MDQPLNPELTKALTRKQEINRLEETLFHQRDSNQGVSDFLHLLQLRFERARDRLLAANPHSFAALQGEANALRELISDVTTPRPILPKDPTYG